MSKTPLETMFIRTFNRATQTALFELYIKTAKEKKFLRLFMDSNAQRVRDYAKAVGIELGDPIYIEE